MIFKEILFSTEILDHLLTQTFINMQQLERASHDTHLKGEKMDEIDLSNLLEDEDALLKAIGLSYMGLALYLGMKTKPIKRGEPLPEPRRPRTQVRTLSDMIRTMMEEAYGIER